MTYGGTSEAERLRAVHEQRKPYESPLELVASPTFHYEHEPLPDGTTIVWPVLDGPLPPAVIGDADDDWDECL